MSNIDRLKTKLAEWNQWMKKDPYSITKQLSNILWCSAFYISINESRKHLENDGDGEKIANGTLHKLIDDGYVVLNAMAIRRLLEQRTVKGPRGVYSLYGLIKDIEKHCNLLTRENVLAAQELEYDYGPIRQQDPQRAHEIQHWHQAMDSLCGVTENRRHKLDCPDPKKFEELADKLAKRGEAIGEWVNKFVAHAATHESRETLRISHHSVTFGELWSAECAIIKAANFISCNIVTGTYLGGVPTPQFDQFEYLDKAFVEPKGLSAMESAWDTYSKKIESYEQWTWDQPLAEDTARQN